MTTEENLLKCIQVLGCVYESTLFYHLGKSESLESHKDISLDLVSLFKKKKINLTFDDEGNRLVSIERILH